MKIRAYVVVCASGHPHRAEHKGHRLYVKDEDAERMSKWHDLIRLKCGPHSVVALSGEFPHPKPKAKRRRRT